MASWPECLPRARTESIQERLGKYADGTRFRARRAHFGDGENADLQARAPRGAIVFGVWAGMQLVGGAPRVISSIESHTPSPRPDP